MKKTGLFLGIILGMIYSASAQTGKLQDEGKMVCIYFHSQWCDACRLMEKEVLSDTNVISFYHENFRWVSADSEKEKALVQKYKVVSFPAYLFLNAEGEVVHKIIGYHPASDFIRAGVIAREGRQNLKTMNRRFDEGERGMDFLKEYMNVLRKAGDVRSQEIAELYVETSGLKERFRQGERNPDFMEQYAKVLEAANLWEDLNEFVPVFLNSLPIEKLATRRNWKWLSFFRHLSQPVRYVIENPLCFEEAAGGRENVKVFVAGVLQNETAKYMQGLYRDPFYLNLSGCDSLICYMRTVASEVVPGSLAKLMALKCLKLADYAGLLNCLQKASEYHMINFTSSDTEALVILEKLRGCDDKRILSESVEWMNSFVQGIEDKKVKKRLMILITDLSKK